MAAEHDRLAHMLDARPLTIQLSIGLERRLRAHLHRINAEIAAEGPDRATFDSRDDFHLAGLMEIFAEQALSNAEEEAETRYDTCTGWPVAHLEELPSAEGAEEE
jgi:hypothetical protein